MLRLHSLLLGFSLSISLLPAQGSSAWEPIAPDYTNVRGINYIAAYEGLTAPSNRPTGYAGVASSTAMWRFWNAPGSSAEIDQQLDYVVGLGLNSIRVWLSWPLWAQDRASGATNNRMTDAFADLLARCEARHLYVVPVLWDDVCAGQNPCMDPDYADLIGEAPPHANIQHWIPNPGQPKIDEFHASGFTSPEFVDYVTELVTLGSTSPALLMWDAMNEPSTNFGDPSHQLEMIDSTLALIKQADSSATTTVGFTGVEESFAAAEIVRNPDLDVISVHPYGTFLEVVQLHFDYAEAIVDGFGLRNGKPVIITEIGNPGYGQPYKDVLEHVENVVRTAPTAGTGSGYFVFSLMCGWEDGNFPFREQQGIYFLDGQVRDIQGCIAIQGTARSAGVPEIQLTQSFQQKNRLAPDFYAQAPLQDGHDYLDTLRNMALPQWYYSLVSPSEGQQLANLFEVLHFDLITLSSGPSAPLIVPPSDQGLLNLILAVWADGGIGGIQLPQSDLNMLLDTWRLTLLPYVATLEGSNPN